MGVREPYQREPLVLVVVAVVLGVLVRVVQVVHMVTVLHRVMAAVRSMLVLGRGVLGLLVVCHLYLFFRVLKRYARTPAVSIGESDQRELQLQSEIRK